MAAPQKVDPVGFTGFAITAMDPGMEGLIYLGSPVYSQLKAKNAGEQAIAKYQQIICVSRQEDYLLVAASTIWTVSALGEITTDLYPKTDKALLLGKADRRWLEGHLWNLYVYGALKQNLAVDAGVTIDGMDVSDLLPSAHKTASPIDHPDGSVTAAKLASGVVLKLLDNYSYTTPGDPPTTTSGSFVHDGLAIYFTPKTTGRVFISISFYERTDHTAATWIYSNGRYGTGTAPAAGAAATGTAFGVEKQSRRETGGWQTGGSKVAVVTGLTLNTQYWFDLVLAAFAGTVGHKNIEFLIVEG